MLKKLVKASLRKFGYKVEKIQSTQSSSNPSALTMEGALQRCIKRGLDVKSVIDVGASNGQWSRMCLQHMPKAEYLLIEAQDAHRQGLEQFRAEYSNANFVIAAAGKAEGKIYFDNSDLLGGVASETPFQKNSIVVPVITIDAEIDKRQLQPPYLLKLDTHGFEIPILEGALETIKKANLIIIETYNYKLTNNSLKYFEMCAYLEKLGFSSIELVDFMLRQHDYSFWQMDTFFIPSGSPEFKHNSYK
jgi:FkbM family methyltransferase